ncbi:MAG: bifunctional DNA primase/polymerase [Candidatus Bathyarchaeales archaeon]
MANFNMLKNVARRYWLEGCNIILLRGKEPLHKWQRWQNERQRELDFEALPWAEADSFALIMGQQLHNELYIGAVDFDVKNLPPEVKEKGKEILKYFPITQIEETPSGGQHWVYYCHVKPKTVSAYHNECGLELLGEGKICIMAPSVGYRKLNDNTPTVVEDLETLFYQALEKAGIKVEKPSQAWFGQPDLAKQPYKGKAPPCINALLKGVEEGIRNESAIRLASYFLNFKRLPWARTLEVLQSWNSKNRPPLPDSELKNILKSAEIHGYVYGCNDDVLKAFCDKAKCPFGLENLTPIEILKLEIAESENIIIHPLIDYNSKVGLTLGIPLSKHAFPGASNQFLVFMAEKPFILPKKPPENEADFPTHVQLKQARWLAVSPTYKKESLLVFSRSL